MISALVRVKSSHSAIICRVKTKMLKLTIKIMRRNTIAAANERLIFNFSVRKEMSGFKIARSMYKNHTRTTPNAIKNAVLIRIVIVALYREVTLWRNEESLQTQKEASYVGRRPLPSLRKQSN